MKCPTPAELAEAVAEAEAAPELARHLEKCACCRALGKQLNEDLELLSDLSATLAAPDGIDDAFPEWEAPRGIRLDRVHSRGGQGIVFRATELQSGKAIALKMLPEGSYASSRQERRFEREIELASELVHPHIVRIHDAGKTERGGLYLSMEFIEGQNVEVHMIAVRNTPALDTVDEALRIFEQVCEAVEYAHRHGVIHRDLKPDNVLVDTDGNVRVLDFGMARLVEAGSSLTLSGQFLGSLPWAAPEQVRTGGEVDVRTDVHALGLLLYLLLTGEPPFGRPTSLADTVRAIETRARPRPSKAAPDLRIGRDLDAIVGKALGKEPADRYTSVSELLRDVRAYRSGRPVSASSVGTWLRVRRGVMRHPWLTAAVVAGFGLVLAFALVRGAQSTRAGQELVRSTIERARLENRIGEEARAERRLWSGEVDLAADRRPTSVEEELKWMRLWALRELTVEQAWTHAVRTPITGDVEIDRRGEVLFLHSASSSRIELRRTGDLGLIRSIEARVEGVRLMAVEPQLREVAYSDDSPVVYRVDLETDQTHAVDVGEAVNALDYSSRGELLIGTYAGNVLRAVGAGVVLVGRLPQPSRIRSIQWVEGAARWIVSDVDGRMAFVDGESGAWEVGPEVSDRGYLRVEPGGRRASQTMNDQVHLLVGPEFQSAWSFPLAITPDTRAAFDPATGGLATTGAYGNRVALLAPESGEQVRTFGGHTQRITDLAFTEDGARLITVDRGGLLRARHLVRSPGLESAAWADEFPDSTTHEVTVDPRGGRLALCGGWGVAVREHGRPLRYLLRDEFVPSVALAPDGALLAVTYSGRVLRWPDVPSGEPEVVFTHPPGASSLALRDDGLVATAGRNGAVRFWDPESDEVRAYDDATGHRFSSLAWTPGGHALAGRRDGVLVRIDPADGSATELEGRHDAAVRSLAIHPDGSLLASGGSDQNVLVWTTDGQLLHRLEGHGAEVYAVAFDPTGAVLASADRSGRLRIWDPRHGRVLAELHPCDFPIFGLAFARNGRELWIGAEGATVLVWHLDDTDRRIESCRSVFAPRESHRARDLDDSADRARR